MANPRTRATGRTRIKRGPGTRLVDGKSFRLADEVRYLQRRAAEHDERIVTIGPFVLFSSKTGDAWLLDAADHLAVRIARDGDPEPVHIEDADTTFTVEWKGQYRIEGGSFVYVDGHTGRVTAMFGYPTEKLVRLG
jgi:hypothetical protein